LKNINKILIVPIISAVILITSIIVVLIVGISPVLEGIGLITFGILLCYIDVLQEEYSTDYVVNYGAGYLAGIIFIILGVYYLISKFIL